MTCKRDLEAMIIEVQEKIDDLRDHIVTIDNRCRRVEGELNSRITDISYLTIRRVDQIIEELKRSYTRIEIKGETS